ncbi:MAG: AAA family ATPase [Bacteroidia bacterium]|nr:AAA family ATPase [Bacteroidia bacterium]
MNNKKRLITGNSNYKGFIENNGYFVDKTLLIKEIIDSSWQVLLIPRPRRFGKTLNLSMLRYFFDTNEKDTEKLFKDYKIWKAGEYYIQKQGKYPVIYLTFKDVITDNWQACLEHFEIDISELFTDNRYLLDSDLLSESEKQACNDIINGKASQSSYEKSLKNLCKYLSKYHKQNVVILIDEYDTPIHAGYQNKYYEKVISFMRNFLSGAFKDNDYLYKGVITGILRVSKESIFSGLNNLGIYTLLNYDFSDKFGFTEDETKEILKRFNLENKYTQVKQWYDGYIWGNIKNIYNPWSITSYIAKYKEGFNPHWVNTSSDELIKKRINERSIDYIKENIQTLVENKTIKKEINENIVFKDLDTNKELLWSLLTFSGYLNPVKNIKGKIYELCIPNYEIKTLFQDIIIEWLNINLQTGSSLVMNACYNLTSNKIEEFEKDFKTIMGDTLSYFNIAKEPERVFQSYILGLLAILGDDYIIKSDREAGLGRYDILLLPHNKTAYGILIEIKTLKKDATEKQIQTELQSALQQIAKNKYYKELIHAGINKRIEMAMVFTGKEVSMKSKTTNSILTQ